MGQVAEADRWALIERARRLYFERNDRPESLVGTTVLRSWERCRTTGLEERSDTGAADPSGETALREARDRNHRLISHGLGIVDALHEQIRESSSVVILADSTGMVLHRVGDPGFLSRAEQVALTPGASWDERLRGTNAVGTAIVERVPTEINGGEHFLTRNSFLTCSASPIVDPQGELIGVLDISGDHRGYQPHTLGLVRMGVQLLERNLFEAEFASELMVALHLRPESVGCLDEAVLAVSADGQVLGASQAAVRLLGVTRANLTRADFRMLFDMPLGTLLDRTDGNPRALVALETRGGGRLYACVKGTAPRALRHHPVQVPAEAPVARIGSRAGKARKALALEELRTGDARMALAIDRALRITGKDIPMLIQGESGAGKEMFAKAFHFSGDRSDGEFVALNCAAIPENLIESELFGYSGGAFTGARKEGAVGKIQQAHGGTLFLDEIGDMPLHLQARLLRVLQERCVTPVGAVKPIPVDISLVCATHRNLREEVAAGRFREDLYYRVNGLTVTLPALRERSDLPCLVGALLKQEGDGRDLAVSAEVMARFEAYDWPGNIRQLHNALRLAVALLEPDERSIEAVHLPEELFATESFEDRAHEVSAASPPESCGSAQMRLEAIEREAIDQALAAVGGNVSAAARRLGISRNTLYRKLGRL